jgi:hypothetical protein
MESILWACDLLALVYLCFWAIRQDKEKQAQATSFYDSAEKTPEFSQVLLQE